MRARAIANLLLVSSAALIIAFLGCDSRQRHRTLAFFFDGVPPRAGEAAPIKPDPWLGASGSLAGSAGGGALPAEGLITHPPTRNCQNCHAKDSKTALPVLAQPVPQLCYQCHSNYASARGYVHGPVAVGACLFCHEPHRSKSKGLIRQEEPKLCQQCHQEQDLLSAPAHRGENLESCTRCHDPHLGSDHHLLRQQAAALPSS